MNLLTTSVRKRCMPFIAMCMALMFTSCFTPRKAELRRCGKADRLISKAVWLCPDVLSRDSATAYMPGDSVTVALSYRDSVEVDSILAACAQLRDALSAELERARMPAPRPKYEPPGAAPARVAPSPGVNKAVAQVRAKACEWEPFTEVHGNMTIHLRPGPNGPLVTVVEAPQEVRVPCPPAIQRPPCPTLMDRLQEAGWILLGWLALAALLLFLFLHYVLPLFPKRRR